MLDERCRRRLGNLLFERIGYLPIRPSQAVFELLRERSTALGISANALLTRLATDQEPDLLDRLVDEVTVSHTGLFRHPEQFDYLRKVLPILHGRVQRPLQVWSAGCATGEEAYSIAACADEVGVPLSVLGTDISPAAVRQAREGRYRRRAGRKGPANPWIVPETLKRMVEFEVRSIVGPDPTCRRPRFDLIFCRNVLIYFDRQATPVILERLASFLRPGGAVVISPADTVLPLPDMLMQGSTVGWLRLRGDDSPLSRRTPAVSRSSLPPPAREISPVDEAARLLGAGDLEAAEALLTDLLNGNPDQMECWFLLGEVLAQRGEIVQARSAFSRVKACRSDTAHSIDAATIVWAAERRSESLREV